jgi:hypothetical protein
MQTGAYLGNGNNLSIKGLGFAPDLVILKSNSTIGVGTMFKTSSMIDAVDVVFAGTANQAGSISLDPDGFTVSGVNSNTVNAYYTWIAFGGSDCSSTGNFCVGTYVGNGTSPRAINIGFQPDLVWVKPSGATAVTWRSSVMPTNRANYFQLVAEDSTGAFFTTLDSTGFTVGASNNASTFIHYYVAFKNTTNAVSVGSYTGTGVAQNINVGFHPNFVFVKNSVTPEAALYNVTESLGFTSYYFSDTASVTTGITNLITSPVQGFSVGTLSAANGSTNTIYYVAFAGATETRNSSGTFKMAKGSYTGTGTTGNYITVDNLPFEPDLVIVKGNTTQHGVFRTSLMYGDATAYFSNASGNFAGGIVNLITTPVSGFSVDATARSNGNTNALYYMAFGGASDTRNTSGSFTMARGTYTGTGNVGTFIQIDNLEFEPDLVIIKGDTGQVAGFRTSLMEGDMTAIPGFATAHSVQGIVAIESNGFTIGLNLNLNTSGATYYWEAFGGAWNANKNSGSADFLVGTYFSSGTDNSNITRLPFQPDLITIKANTSTAGAFRTSTHTGDLTSHFSATAEVSNVIQSISANGFQLGNSTLVNTSAALNDYFAFKSGSNFAVGSYNGNGAARDITVGFRPDYIWVKNPEATNAGISRSSSQTGDGGLPFPALTNVTDTITGIISTGFSVGISSYVNQSGVNNYRWVAWRATTTSVISIVISDGSITFGSMNFNTSKDTVTLSDTQHVTNNGNVGIDIAIKGFDTAYPWALSSSAGVEQYKYEYSLNAGGSWTPITTTYNNMITNLGASVSDDFDLKLTTPTTTDCTSQQTVDITLIATEN